MGGIDAGMKRRLIEDVGMLFEDPGLPRMSGRVFGWLLISSLQHQTAGEIAAGLGASKGSMSTMLRMLAQFGMIERFGLHGERSAYCRARPAYSVGMMRAKMGFVRRFHELAERALDAVDGSDPERRRRLEETRDFYHTFERELNSLLERLSGGGSGGDGGSARRSAKKPAGGGRR